MKNRKRTYRGHVLIEVLIAIVLSAIVLTVFFNLDSGIKQALEKRMSDSNQYTALLLMRHRLASDIRNSTNFVLRKDSLLELSDERGDSVLYRLHDQVLYRNGVRAELSGLKAKRLDMIPAREYSSMDQKSQTDSLLALTLVGSDADTVKLNIPLKSLAEFKIHRR